MVPKALSRNDRRSTCTARVVTAVLVGVLSASFTEAGRAQAEPPRPGASSVSQYVELVPAAGGPIAPGVETERRTPLQPKAQRALDDASSSVADALATVATSSNYGAPRKPRPGAAEGALRDAPSPTEEPTLDQALLSITTAATSPGDTRMIALLLVLVAVTVGAAALGVRTRLRS